MKIERIKEMRGRLRLLGILFQKEKTMFKTLIRKVVRIGSLEKFFLTFH